MYDNRPRPRADNWKFQDRSKMTRAQKVILDRKILNRSAAEYEYPKSQGKVPVNLEWSQHMTLFPLAMIPIVARWLFMRLTGWTVHPVILYMLTVVFNSHFTRQHFYRLRRYVETHGFLDGEVERDSIPESMVGKLYNEMLNGLLGRPLMVIFLSYDRTKLPTLSWWLPLQLAVFTIIADFVYYWVHRATHEIPWLWKFHRLHHTTKHPSSYLLGFADEPQELFDAFGTPILTYMAYPIGFDAFYIWSLYFNSIEIMGHSGVRAYYPGVLVSTKMIHDRHRFYCGRLELRLWLKTMICIIALVGGTATTTASNLCYGTRCLAQRVIVSRPAQRILIGIRACNSKWTEAPEMYGFL